MKMHLSEGERSYLRKWYGTGLRVSLGQAQIHQQLMQRLDLKAIERKVIALPKLHSPVLTVCWVFVRKSSLFSLQGCGKRNKSEGKQCTING